MKCAKCPSEARGHVEMGQVHYPLCNYCAKAVEESAARVVIGLKGLFRNQRHVQRLWEKA